jgi:hypothetical protein
MTLLAASVKFSELVHVYSPFVTNLNIDECLVLLAIECHMKWLVLV